MKRSHTLKDLLLSARSHSESARVSGGMCGSETKGERHLLRLVRRTHLLINPPFLLRSPVLRAHPSLQFLQTLLHMRGHL